jgi:molybdopterin/thiamine biosynthesis adenylyltransferase
MTTPTPAITSEDTTFKADFGDQVGFFNPDKVGAKVTVIGCGGIGASILPTLVTMGFKHFVLIDGDTVEPRNVTTNLIYRPKDLYKSKVKRCREYLLDFGAESVEIHEEMFEGQVALSGLVISGVDSLKARKTIWEFIQLNSDILLYMDGRIGGLNATLLTVEPFNLDHIEWYEKFHLALTDEQVTPLRCTQRTIVYPAVSLGTYVAANLADWSRGLKVPVQTNVGFGLDRFFQIVFLDEDATS